MKKERLISEILIRFEDSAIKGAWPKQKCKYCPGRSEGYSYSQYFLHTEECPIPLIKQLRRMVREGEEEDEERDEWAGKTGDVSWEDRTDY